jgi:tRNA pseudouridine32 synthase/23S rRNA pseudouridine746 synthase
MSICAINGKPARSRYRVVERFYQGTGLPLTRVKLTRRPGEPISCVFTASSWGTRFWAAICMAVLTPGAEETPRLMLHASELNFIHPVSGEPVNARHAAPF